MAIVLEQRRGAIHRRDVEKRREIVEIAGGATIRGAQPRDWEALGAHPPLDPATGLCGCSVVSFIRAMAVVVFLHLCAFCFFFLLLRNSN